MAGAVPLLREGLAAVCAKMGSLALVHAQVVFHVAELVGLQVALEAREQLVDAPRARLLEQLLLVEGAHIGFSGLARIFEDLLDGACRRALRAHVFAGAPLCGQLRGRLPKRLTGRGQVRGGQLLEWRGQTCTLMGLRPGAADLLSWGEIWRKILDLGEGLLRSHCDLDLALGGRERGERGHRQRRVNALLRLLLHDEHRGRPKGRSTGLRELHELVNWREKGSFLITRGRDLAGSSEVLLHFRSGPYGAVERQGRMLSDEHVGCLLDQGQPSLVRLTHWLEG